MRASVSFWFPASGCRLARPYHFAASQVTDSAGIAPTTQAPAEHGVELAGEILLDTQT